MIAFLIAFIIVSLSYLFLGSIHGIVGAVIIGLNMVAVDYGLQCLRIKFLKKVAPGRALLLILAGLVLRTLCIILFLKLGVWWLGSESVNFYVVLMFLIFIPIIGLVEAHKFKMETGKNNGSSSK